MRSVRLFEIEDCSMDAAMRAKGTSTVSLCIPCRDEAATIGPLVSCIRTELMRRWQFVDELIVVDDRSTDDTAHVAASAGATVVRIEDVHARYGEGHGKGNVLWASLASSTGDFVVWIDGDI